MAHHHELYGVPPRLLATLATTPAVAERLTPRQLQVVALAGEGLSIEETAARLYVSPETVRTHRKAALRRLGVRNMAQAVAALKG